jgi:hypothetical protein
MRFPTRRAGKHDLFFSTVLTFAYARRFINVDIDKPIYPDLAATALRGRDAIERSDLEDMFCAVTAAQAELEGILSASKPADHRRHYWLQLSQALVWDPGRRGMRRLRYEEKVSAMMRMFKKSRRQVERDIASLPDKISQ